MLVVDGDPLLSWPAHAALLPSLAIVIEIQLICVRLSASLLTHLGSLPIDPFIQYLISVKGSFSICSEAFQASMLEWFGRREYGDPKVSLVLKHTSDRFPRSILAFRRKSALQMTNTIPGHVRKSCSFTSLENEGQDSSICPPYKMSKVSDEVECSPT